MTPLTKTLLRQIKTLSLLIALCMLAAFGQAHARVSPAFTVATVSFSELPQEARTTINLIRKGGPFPYRRDGIEFQNRENRLPPRTRGYYHEYTVSTPGASDRGARRIIAGSAEELYFTADHYRSFRRVVP